MNRGIAFVLFLLPSVAIAQNFTVILINTLPLTATCDGEVLLPDGVPVQVRHDPDQEGLGVLDELIGVFGINGEEQGIGPGRLYTVISGPLPSSP